MKKSILIIVIFLCMKNAFSQYQLAVNAPIYANSTGGAKQTNCDMCTGQGSPSADTRVTAIVCDGTNPVLFSEAYNTTTKIIEHSSSTPFFYNDVIFPDVCLVGKTTGIWAIVIYRSLSHGICLETFLWNNSSSEFQSISFQVLSTQQTKTSFPHIDSDRNDYWAATWDEMGSSYIHTCVGRTNANGPFLVTNCNNGNAILDFPVNLTPATTELSEPDVAIYSNTGVSTPVVFIHYTFLTNDKKVVVETYPITGNVYTDICDGNNGSLPAANVDVIESFSGVNNYVFSPRITTHREANTGTIMQDGFAVVYNRIYTNGTTIYTSDIGGRNYFCTATACKYTPALTSPPNDYTDGSLDFYNIMPAKFLPKVNYNWERNILISITMDRGTGTYTSAPANNGSNNLIIGWTHANSTNTVWWPVMLYANVESGEAQVPVNFFPTNPYLINNVSSVMNNSEVALSVCSSETGVSYDVLYAWYDALNGIVAYKHVLTGSKMRMAGELLNGSQAGFFPQLIEQGIQLPELSANTKLNLQLIDAKGSEVLKSVGDLNTINGLLKQVNANLQSGIYVLILSNSNQLVYKSKLIQP